MLCSTRARVAKFTTSARELRKPISTSFTRCLSRSESRHSLIKFVTSIVSDTTAATQPTRQKSRANSAGVPKRPSKAESQRPCVYQTNSEWVARTRSGEDLEYYERTYRGPTNTGLSRKEASTHRSDAARAHSYPRQASESTVIETDNAGDPDVSALESGDLMLAEP